MTKTLTIAAALAITLAGCATAPNPNLVTVDSDLIPPSRDVCYAVDDLEQTIRRNRAKGISADAQKAGVARAAINRGMAKTRRGNVIGGLAYLIIDHVYEGRADSAVNRCLDERWPQMLYVATF